MRASLGGGALLDVGCYTVNVSRWILGEPDGVLATLKRDSSPDDGVDTTVTGLLHFPGGATAPERASVASPERQERAAVERERSPRPARPSPGAEAPHQ